MNGGGSTALASHTVPVPAGGYAIESMTPWGGAECAGVTPCNPSPIPSQITAVVTVVAGQTTTYTFHSIVPTITGGHGVGSRLSIHVTPGLAMLGAALRNQGHGDADFTQQWRRGSTDIRGAIGRSYTAVRADALQSISARLIPSKGQLFVYSSMGLAPQALTTNAIGITKFTPVKTVTQIKVPKRFKRTEPVTMTVTVRPRVAATATGLVLQGAVVVKIGKYKVRKTLQNRSVLVTLPRLPAGKHAITVTYTGSTYFAPSTGKVTVRVRR